MSLILGISFYMFSAEKVGHRNDCTENTIVNVDFVINMVKIMQPLVLNNIPIKPDEKDNHLCAIFIISEIFLTIKLIGREVTAGAPLSGAREINIGGALRKNDRHY